MARLTDRQRQFVEEYLVDLNATQAAIRAGYSQKTAEQLGYQLLQKPLVQAEIQAAMERRAKRTGITQDRVVEELGKVAFAEAADGSDSELKYSNKLRALELLGKHLGLFDSKGDMNLRVSVVRSLDLSKLTDAELEALADREDTQEDP